MIILYLGTSAMSLSYEPCTTTGSQRSALCALQNFASGRPQGRLQPPLPLRATSLEVRCGTAVAVVVGCTFAL